MENKINIAEILKDCSCSSGMELDCTIYEDVYFDYVDELNIIHCYIQHETYKTSLTFNQYGIYNSGIKAKCVIFPKGKTTWEGFAPPCEFKDGDIISNGRYVAIFHKTGKPENCVYSNVVYYHCWYNNKYTYNKFKAKIDFGIGGIEEYKYATEKEKEKLFQVIKDNGYRWNANTKTLEKLIKPKFKVGNRITKRGSIENWIVSSVSSEYYGLKLPKGIESIGVLPVVEQDSWELVPNKFDITTLVPFESKVLARNNECCLWKPAIFGFYNKANFYMLGGSAWRQCIPYEGNEHLCGTTNDCDEYYKTW